MRAIVTSHEKADHASWHHVHAAEMVRTFTLPLIHMPWDKRLKLGGGQAYDRSSDDCRSSEYYQK
jgi:hypothetical protein